MTDLIGELQALSRRFSKGAHADRLGSNLVDKAIMALKAREIDPATSFELGLLAEMLIGQNRAADVELLQRTARKLKEPSLSLPVAYRRSLQRSPLR